MGCSLTLTLLLLTLCMSIPCFKVTCGIYEDHNRAAYNIPATYMQLADTAKEVQVEHDIAAFETVSFKFSNLRALTVYDFYCSGTDGFGDFAISDVLKFATRQCALGFYANEAGFCIHESIGIHFQDSTYAYQNDENWYDEYTLRYYGAWREGEYESNSPHVVHDVKGIESTFEEQVESLKYGMGDEPSNRLVQIEHKYAGREYDMFGNFDGDESDGAMTEEELLEEYHRLQKLYENQNDPFSTRGKIYSLEESHMNYERL